MPRLFPNKMTARLTVLLLCLVVSVLFAMSSMATTKNPPTGAAGYTPMAIPINGTYSSNTTGIVSFRAPTGYVIQHASIAARAVTGTNPTLKIRGKDAVQVRYSGTTNGLTSTDLKLTTGAVMTDEAVQSVDLVPGGTSPKWKDLTLFLFLKQK